MDLGKTHVMLVHFPIALAVAAIGADILWLATRRAFFRHAGFYCLIIALISAPVTLYTGGVRLTAMGLLGPAADLAGDHRQFAFASSAALLAATAARLVWIKVRRRWIMVLYGLLMAALFVLISIAGDLGGQVANGWGFLKGVF